MNQAGKINLINMNRYAGKVAVVTGASVGIGAAIVEELVKHGVIVAGLARRVEQIQEQAKKFSGAKGKLHAFKCDMTKEDEIVSTFKEIIKNLGNIHILVNNAGIMRQTDLINGDTEKWKISLDTNILGLCIATREAMQDIKKNNISGHIIHINSIVGHKVIDLNGSNVYPATKYAVTALAETLRMDITKEKLPVKITSISPGYVKSEFAKTAGLGDELEIPPLYPKDIADAVIYALSTPPHVNVNELTLQAVGSA